MLPPTTKVQTPLERLAGGHSPFYLNTEASPWFSQSGGPRRAAVSAFGFGGSNFHCVLEEAAPAKTEVDWDGDVQIVALSADEQSEIREQLTALDGLSDCRPRSAPRPRGAARRSLTTKAGDWSWSRGAARPTGSRCSRVRENA